MQILYFCNLQTLKYLQNSFEAALILFTEVAEAKTLFYNNSLHRTYKTGCIDANS